MIVDTNVSLGLWPFRRLPGDTPADLVARLKKRCVVQGWAGSFDGVFHRDFSSANARLARACEATGGFLLPFGSVNPKAPGWREDLRRCHEVHRMPGIRLHANYHGYTLADPLFAELLRAARERKLLVQLVLSLEDERTQHPLMMVAPVDPAPLRALIQAAPGLRLVVLNRVRNPAGEALAQLSSAGEVYFDFAMTEGVGCVADLMASVSPERVVFGSHAPFQYFESTLLKVKESGITGAQEAAILGGNAKRLLSAGAGTTGGRHDKQRNPATSSGVLRRSFAPERVLRSVRSWRSSSRIRRRSAGPGPRSPPGSGGAWGSAGRWPRRSRPGRRRC